MLQGFKTEKPPREWGLSLSNKIQLPPWDDAWKR